MVKAVEKAEPAKDDATKAEEPSKEEAETAELKKIADYLRGRKGIAVRARIVSSSRRRRHPPPPFATPRSPATLADAPDPIGSVDRTRRSREAREIARALRGSIPCRRYVPL
jgi:hypothetical protein